jgi:hypothetical protein
MDFVDSDGILESEFSALSRAECSRAIIYPNSEPRESGPARQKLVESGRPYAFASPR